LIKELPSLVPTDDGRKFHFPLGDSGNRPDSPSSLDSSSTASFAGPRQQQHGDKTSEAVKRVTTTAGPSFVEDATAPAPSLPAPGLSRTEEVLAPEPELQQPDDLNPAQQQLNQQAQPPQGADSIGKSPGEIAFFKLLHAEFKKASHFFDRAEEEFTIREERVREGMEIMKQPNSIMVNEKWSLLGKSIYRLYKDLLLLETFAIMTYCSFSKILKKHDKVTGYETRIAFMANIVNQANFTSYPKVLEMISRCERLYEEVSEHLLREGKDGLYEDERLFINMIHRLNEQVLDTAEGEGAERKEQPRRPPVVQIANMPSAFDKESRATLSLRSLVEENDKNILAAQVSEGQCCDCDGEDSDTGSKETGNICAERANSPPTPVAMKRTTSTDGPRKDDDSSKRRRRF
jgi:hypothetical protein